MYCPSCGLINPPTAKICDCGHNFETKVRIKRKKKRYPFLAAIATFGVFGLGQLYNGKPGKAAVSYTLWFAIAVFAIVVPLSTGYAMLVVPYVLLFFLGLILIFDAVRDARTRRAIALHWYNRWYLYLAIIMIQVLAIYPLQARLLKSSSAAYGMPAGSMEPTLKIGDRMVADMKAYERKLPNRGDLIIFKYPKNESMQYIKRLVGLPGEKVEIIGRTVFVNGHALVESYVQYLYPKSFNEHYGPADIPHNQYFVLGDNRDNSQDSRHFGFVKRTEILGQARYLYWAKDWSRIGKQLK